MLTVACVCVGDYLQRGDLYTERLKASVARNLAQPYKFECITESPWLGWWSKISLFEPGRFSGRVLYLDLDVVVTGSLDLLAEHAGIIHLADWGWKKNDYCSSVMVWDGDEHARAFNEFNDDVQLCFRGDQDWLTCLGGWAALPRSLNASYRYHATKAPPKDAVTVSFHGKPKPHECGGWVADYWRS